MENSLKEAVLQLHEFPVPGKISVTPTKPLATSKDLALTYSPGIAAPCMEIHVDPQNAYKYVARGNLVAVVSNGTVMLGLGNIGALAGKLATEDEGVLFRKFVGVGVFDTGIDEEDPQKLMDVIASLGPTFGGVNLENIKAPECFYIEHELRKRYKVLVFHGDQHGIVIITVAAALNVLHYTGHEIEEATLVCSGADAVAIACSNQLLDSGSKRENVTACGSKGVIYKTREDRNRMDESKQFYAIKDNDQRVSANAVKGKNILLSLSGTNLLTPEMPSTMNEKPIVFAMANPSPEILPPLAKETHSDVVIGTGRSNFSNQMDNILCFPFISRGTLNVGTTTVNGGMKHACVYALAGLAMEEVTEEVAAVYGKKFEFGAEYLIPTPFGSRLLLRVVTVTTKTAMGSGVIICSIVDLDAYAAKLAGLKL